MKISRAKIVNVKCGKRVKIITPSNLYDCQLGDDVFIGPFVEIQKGVKIGNATKIQSHTFICELVDIGKDCMVAHGVMFINDLFQSGGPAHGNKKNGGAQLLEIMFQSVQMLRFYQLKFVRMLLLELER